MDPNIMKFFEEDEDETMHSGADVDAFTAELNRDIEWNTSYSNAAVLPQGSNHTTSQFLPQWAISGHDGIGNFQSVQDIAAMGEKDQHSSEMELQRHDSDPQNREDDRNTFSLPQPVGGRPSGEQFIIAQVLDHEAKPVKELQVNKLQNISHHSSMVVGSNGYQPLSVESNDQQILPTSKGNQQKSMGISNDQVMPTFDQHTTGMSMTSQQAITAGMSSPQIMTSSSQQPVTTSKSKENGSFGFSMFFTIILSQCDKVRAKLVNNLGNKLKKNEISKDDFFREMRNIVGEQMLRMAIYKAQTQLARNSETAPNQYQSQPQASERKIQVHSGGANPSPNPVSQRVASEITSNVNESPGHVRSFVIQLPTDLSNSHGAQVDQMSTSISGALSHERKHPAFLAQGLNKQQNMQLSQTSFPSYGSAGSGYAPFQTTTAASSAAVRPHPLDSQMRQAPSHPNLAVNHLVPTSQPMKVTNMSTFDRPHSLTDQRKIPAGSLVHMNSNTVLQQNHVQRSSSTIKDQKTAISPSGIHVKQELSDQSNDQQRSCLPPAVSKLGSIASGSLKTEPFEIQSSRAGLTPLTTLVPSCSVSSPSTSVMEINILSSSQATSLTAPVGPGNNSKAHQKKPLGQKKPMEAPGTQPPLSKKQKVSGSFADQSIEHLNDVTAVSGVNLREEEEQLFSGSKEDSRVSEASRRVVQEEEEKLILQKIPLQKIMVEIMAKCGLKNTSKDVERCLSLCVEERMYGLISNVIRLSKQRVDMEKPRHKTVITTDVRQQILVINRKAHEEWEKKQAESEKSQKLNDPESSTGVNADKEKDETRGKSIKVNKEEDDKMRATAANVAVRAATGVGDITSRWQLMIDAKQKQGGSDSPQTNKDVGQKPLATSKRNTKEDQESEKRDPSVSLSTHASIRKVGRNQVVVPRVARSVSVKDVIAVLEREPQMSKSTLLYRLYQKVSVDAVSE